MTLDASLQRVADRMVYTHTLIGLAVILELLVLELVRMPDPVYIFPLVANTLLVIFLVLRAGSAYRKMRRAADATLFATYQISGGLAVGCALISCIIVAALAFALPTIMSRF